MIFVTVGTHEQQFNRLVEYIDKWAGEHDEDVVIQTGFSTYEPKNCKWQKLFGYQEMGEYIDKARIVITHGGPSSFIAPLQIGKIPVVVPRRKEYNEHVNNHQVTFCREVEARHKNIIVVEDVKKLGKVLDGYDKYRKDKSGELVSNNQKFCDEFEKLVVSVVSFEKKR